MKPNNNLCNQSKGQAALGSCCRGGDKVAPNVGEGLGSNGGDSTIGVGRGVDGRSNIGDAIGVAGGVEGTSNIGDGNGVGGGASMLSGGAGSISACF